jgi:hypothetical protein
MAGGEMIKMIINQTSLKVAGSIYKQKIHSLKLLKAGAQLILCWKIKILEDGLSNKIKRFQVIYGDLQMNNKDVKVLHIKKVQIIIEVVEEEGVVQGVSNNHRLGAALNVAKMAI